MTIIIIDGWHKGEVVEWHTPLTEIKLLKPRTVTVCDCSPGNTDRFEYQPEEIVYRCAFKSIDGDVALFSTTGKSREIFDGFVRTPG